MSSGEVHSGDLRSGDLHSGDLHSGDLHSGDLHATDAHAEAARLMTVCNSCRYCEGLCAVFPAMEMRRVFVDSDLNYLANLCHGCGACFIDCQFSPPHAFDVNVPRVLEQVRTQSWAAYAWPALGAELFARNLLALGLAAALGVAAFLIGFVAWQQPGAVFTPHAGDFYALMPHDAMAALFGAAFVYAVAALGMGVRRFWREQGLAPVTLAVLGQALRDAGRLRYLDGGGDGCFSNEGAAGRGKPDRRRLYHHVTFYGFLACFAATCVATVYHFALGWPAPYRWYDLPVLLGTAGGAGLLVGPAGLLHSKLVREPALRNAPLFAMDTAFIVVLFLTSLSGLALLILRDTAAMGTLLAVHLGIVFAFFLTMPYGKFVHGIYRFAALVRHAQERQK
jgi:citrate/tricarballylate utilization protein